MPLLRLLRSYHSFVHPFIESESQLSPGRAPMAKKRKSAATPLDEVDRTLYSSFCAAANSLSHLYSQSVSHQRFSFQAGERHAMDKLYQWILREQESGSRVTTVDIISYLQHELDHGADEQPQAVTNLSNSAGGPVTTSNAFQTAAKNPVFSNALSSPVRRSLQNYHLTPRNSDSNCPPPQHQHHHNHQVSRETNSNDSAMDMHADSPGQDSVY